MTVSAGQAFLLTQNAAAVQQSDLVNQEITLAEQRVLATATFGLYEIVYSAALVGNPVGDPTVDANLTPNQLAFRNALQTAGYQIGQDATTGYWTISWAEDGPEFSVSVYEINTTVTPGPVSAQTITALNLFFNTTLVPPATDRILLAGTALSGTYIHLAIVTQQNTLDNSTGILGALTAAGLGYTGGNTSVAKRG
jgi:hypothetical protein